MIKREDVILRLKTLGYVFDTGVKEEQDEGKEQDGKKEEQNEAKEQDGKKEEQDKTKEGQDGNKEEQGEIRGSNDKRAEQDKTKEEQYIATRSDLSRQGSTRHITLEDMNELNVTDDEVIDFMINKTQEYIKNYCNVEKVPLGLKYVAIDMCCGSFLKNKSLRGDLGGFDIKEAIKSIKEGDITISYNSAASSSELLHLFIDRLINREDMLICYRKMKW